MEKEPKVAPDTQEVLEKYDKDAMTRQFDKKSVIWIVAIISVLYSLFHVYMVFNPMPALQQRAIHVAIGLVLVYMLYPMFKKQDRTRLPVLDWILTGLSLMTAVYIMVEYQAIVTERGGIPNTLDIIVGIMTVLLILEAARRVTGIILPILALVFLAYPFISHMDFLPTMMLTRPYSPGDIFGQLYLSTEGLYSTAIGASVNFIFLFILFGAFLQKSGMGQFFNDLAMALAGANKGGPAKVAVVSSGFMGSINGAAVANVVSTGAFTIPLMKKVGYNKNFAGAVEASASVGGQILPPIMGASAFIMAETTGINYGVIALAALFPAILYYFAVIMQVHYRAGKRNLQGIPKADLPRVKEVMVERGHLLIPIVGLIVMLFLNFPIPRAAVFTLFLTVIVAMLRKTTRMSPRDVFDALANGAQQALSVMIACAVVGIIIGVVSLTSFGAIMTSAIASLGAGSLFLTLFFTMIASMVLGMGLPSIPAYIITATMAAPALAEFGIPVLLAHMFVFYFGIFANVTPPVALAAFAGAGISGGNPMTTGFQALKLSIAGFLIPYLFIYEPALLMVDTEGLMSNAREYPLANFVDVGIVVVTSLIALTGLAAALEGFFKEHINILFRIILAVAAMLSIVPETYTDIIGVSIVILILGMNYLKWKRTEQFA
ncbi:TRAP transporter permease [Salinicoccus sp. HZC-1]|uniref:TRAP transporter permease n=1 Tax=Salinicoccus sp. HZC-1 TaxID=3385497 RepID=UPI00398B7902